MARELKLIILERISLYSSLYTPFLDPAAVGKQPGLSLDGWMAFPMLSLFPHAVTGMHQEQLNNLY